VAYYLKSEILNVRELNPYHWVLYESHFKRLPYKQKLSGKQISL